MLASVIYLKKTTLPTNYRWDSKPSPDMSIEALTITPVKFCGNVMIIIIFMSMITNINIINKIKINNILHIFNIFIIINIINIVKYY